MSFKSYRPNRPKRARSKAISPQRWERFRDVVEDLYMKQNLTREQVLQALGSMGFHPSRRQITSQFKKWGMRKNQARRRGAITTPDDAEFETTRKPANSQGQITVDPTDPESYIKNNSYYLRRNVGDINCLRQWRGNADYSDDSSVGRLSLSTAHYSVEGHEFETHWQEQPPHLGHDFGTPEDHLREGYHPYASGPPLFEPFTTSTSERLTGVVGDEVLANPGLRHDPSSEACELPGRPDWMWSQHHTETGDDEGDEIELSDAWMFPGHG